jgi:hypothetical protein
MRVYIIGNDGIILCREPPAAVNEGEIAVVSNEELRSAQRQAAAGAVEVTPEQQAAPGHPMRGSSGSIHPRK